MSRLGKWIEGLEPERSVSDAARLSLEARLSAVVHWLPLAAACAHQDVEHVHRLRVSTRRAAAALKLYRDWLPRRPARWLKQRLRKVREAAGEARDLDVLIVRLGPEVGDRGDGLLADITRRRAAAQPAIVAVEKRCRQNDRLQRKIAKLLAGVGPRRKLREADRQRPFREWAAEKLYTAVDQFVAAMPDDHFDTAALHRFRIRGKALRYRIELLAPAFGPELRTQHYPVVEELQERLGRINDHVAGAERLRTWCGSDGEPDWQMLLDDCVEREEAQLADELDQFRRWWTPERAESLRQGLLDGRAEDQSACSPPAEEEVVSEAPS